MSADWDTAFEDLVRAALSTLADDVELDGDLHLPSYGLDSMATMRLLASLEDAYDVLFPLADLDPSHFKTPGGIWSILAVALARPQEVIR